MTDHDLAALLAECRRNNQTSSVTGMLLYRGGKFLQVLEGDARIVGALYKKINLDNRHKNPQLLLSGEQPKRQFPNWSMGFVNLGSYTEQQLPGFSEFFSAGFDSEAMRRRPLRAYRMLLRFREAD